MSFDGIINLYKPVGPSSSDMVVRVRMLLTRKLGQKIKTGHLGTLDPLAEGVLPVAVGKATTLFDNYLKKGKTYLAEFTFGKTTKTLDREADISEVDEDFILDIDRLSEVLSGFVGKVKQLPPNFSAVKINGRRAYDMARAGKEFGLPSREVSISSIELVGTTKDNAVSVRIVCSAGTYIRSLARDIAEKLGTVCYMSALVRESSGEFDVSESVTLDELEESPLAHISPMTVSLYDGYKKSIVLCLGFFDAVHNGHVSLFKQAEALARKYSSEVFVFTFDGAPKGGAELFTFKERCIRLQTLGYGKIIYAPASNTVLGMSGDEFLAILSKNFKIKAVVAGEDYAFGKGAEYGVSKLYGHFDAVEVVPLATFCGEKISSTRVRTLVETGKIAEANELLPLPYSLEGRVERGRGDGARLDYPTANIKIPVKKLVPIAGVYATCVEFNGKRYASVTSVGTHPTFDDDNFNTETHIMDESLELLGKIIRVDFYRRIRDVVKFDNVAALRVQIAKDIEEVKRHGLN